MKIENEMSSFTTQTLNYKPQTSSVFCGEDEYWSWLCFLSHTNVMEKPRDSDICFLSFGKLHFWHGEICQLMDRKNTLNEDATHHRDEKRAMCVLIFQGPCKHEHV